MQSPLWDEKSVTYSPSGTCPDDSTPLNRRGRPLANTLFFCPLSIAQHSARELLVAAIRLLGNAEVNEQQSDSQQED